MFLTGEAGTQNTFLSFEVEDLDQETSDLDFSVIHDSGRISEHCVDISSHFDIFVSVKGSEGPVCSLVSMVTVTFHDDPADWDPKPKV